MTNFSDRLRAVMDSNSISLQRDFANKIGVTESAISYYLSGKRIPRYDVMVRIATIFGVSLDWLMKNEEANNEKIHNHIQ